MDTLVDQLTKQAAQIALRLAALPADGMLDAGQTLDDIEQLAREVLKEVALVRARRTRPVGETRGMWQVVQPVRRQ
jgi:hypothetical protein